MQTTWWLDWSGLPDLLWARLRVYATGQADVLDFDGKLHRFSNEEEATYWLLEDEYSRLEVLVEDGAVEPDVQPPSAPSDAELIPEMVVRAPSHRRPPGQPDTSRP